MCHPNIGHHFSHLSYNEQAMWHPHQLGTLSGLSKQTLDILIKHY